MRRTITRILARALSLSVQPIVTVEEVGAMYATFGREVWQRLISLGSKVGRTVAEQRRLKAAIDEETYKALKAIHDYQHKAAAE